jgi:hypothetical protein
MRRVRGGLGRGSSCLRDRFCDRWFTVAGCLDAAEDLRDFAFKLWKLKVDDRTAGVQDDIDRGGEDVQLVADSFAHAALDVVAIDSSAKGFGNREADSWAWRVATPFGWAHGIEVGNLLGKLLAACLVDELVIGVFAQAVGLHRSVTACARTQKRAQNAEMLSALMQNWKRRLGVAATD